MATIVKKKPGQTDDQLIAQFKKKVLYEEIVEEAKILALKERIDLHTLNEELLRQFLVDHGLGIECSGFVYHILDAELRARGLGALKSHLKFPETHSPWRKLVARLRPVENTNVRVLADEANSVPVSLSDVQSGDIIIFLNAGAKHDRDHVLLVEKAQYNTSTQQHVNTVRNSLFLIPNSLTYIHSFQWRTDGKYHHGVRRGQIEIVDESKPLIEQRWIENGMGGDENETLGHAKTAESVRIRRLKILQ